MRCIETVSSALFLAAQGKNLGGANDPGRRPDGFTGFDQYDNLRVGDLWEPPAPQSAPKTWRPFHVINIILNLASSKSLAWQQRKGISFTVTPKFCGAADDDFGYRRTKEYGDPGDGISLGTAMAISGAAVSPNMGYHSSPSIAFLLTFFNVRLGWWLGNPGAAGDRFNFLLTFFNVRLGRWLGNPGAAGDRFNFLLTFFKRRGGRRGGRKRRRSVQDRLCSLSKGCAPNRALAAPIRAVRADQGRQPVCVPVRWRAFREFRPLRGWSAAAAAGSLFATGPKIVIASTRTLAMRSVKSGSTLVCASASRICRCCGNQRHKARRPPLLRSRHHRVCQRRQRRCQAALRVHSLHQGGGTRRRSGGRRDRLSAAQSRLPAAIDRRSMVRRASAQIVSSAGTSDHDQSGQGGDGPGQCP